MNREDRAEGTVLAMASLCVGLIREDPELIGRLRKAAVRQEAPFENEKIDETVLSAIDIALMTMAQRALEGKGHAAAAMASVHRHGRLFVPVENTAEGAAKSAGALSVASFATEYLHDAEGALEAFLAWLRSKGRTSAADHTSKAALVAADELLTMMAGAAGALAENAAGLPDGMIDLSKLGPDHGHSQI